MNRRVAAIGGVLAAMAAVLPAAAGKRYRYFVHKGRDEVYIHDAEYQNRSVLRRLDREGWREVNKRRAGKELGGGKSEVNMAIRTCVYGRVGRAGHRYTCMGPDLT
jgi:hypothetical protein